MDLYVERQAIEEMQGGDTSKLLLLFDAYFEDLYRYVARRVTERGEVERIVRTSFLDALGQIQNTPLDTGYLVFLYGLARQRTAEWIANQPSPTVAQEDQFAKMMSKLSLEEREILRLKFFEQVTDGDVMVVLGADEGTVGQKIYRVLKRAHFLLFGESDERQGVYFGELSGFFERAKAAEAIEVPEVLKLSLRTDLVNRIERRGLAVEGEAIEEEVAIESEPERPVETPFAVREERPVGAVGSDDPAKIFVEAVKEMREEEAAAAVAADEFDRVGFERAERFADFVDKWKAALIMIPVFLFIFVVTIVLVNVIDFGGVERGYVTTCNVEVQFDGDFSDSVTRSIYKGIGNELCDHFDVSRLLISKTEDGVVDVEVDVPEWMLEYRFVREEYKNTKNWNIKKYERIISSDEQSGEVSGDNGGIERVAA